MAFCGLLMTNDACGSLRASWPVFVIAMTNPMPDGIGPLAGAQGLVEALACMAAVADHVEATVPSGRQVHFEGNLGREHTADAAVLRQIRRLRHDARLDLDEFLVPELRKAGAGTPWFEVAS